MYIEYYDNFIVNNKYLVWFGIVFSKFPYKKTIFLVITNRKRRNEKEHREVEAGGKEAGRYYRESSRNNKV